MSDPESVLGVVRERASKAEGDLTIAAYALTLRENCPGDSICFHAQQCVEKYLKALLTSMEIAFPKSHSIRVLVALLPAASRPHLEVAVQDRLTEYATVTRYPGDYEPIELAEARRAVQTARRVRRDIPRLLPKEALLAKRKR